MRFFKGVMLALILAALAVPVTAKEKTQGGAADNSQTQNAFIKDTISYFGVLAGKFGCPKLAFTDFQRSKTQGLMEFVPQDQDIKSWKRLFTVNEILLPNEEEKVVAYMDGIKDKFIEGFKKHAEVIELNEGKRKDGTPILYMEYTIGEGAEKESAIAVYARHASIASAMTHIQVRRGEVSPGDRKAMRQLFAVLTTR
jgi:hypothetical protein